MCYIGMDGIVAHRCRPDIPQMGEDCSGTRTATATHSPVGSVMIAHDQLCQCDVAHMPAKNLELGTTPSWRLDQSKIADQPSIAYLGRARSARSRPEIALPNRTQWREL